MPVGNQLNFWDGAAWVPHVAATGPKGPVGDQGPPLSVGACAFTGSIATCQPATGTTFTNLTVQPAFTDKQPCLVVSAPNKLKIVRQGTIMISYFIMIGGGKYIPLDTPTSYCEIHKAVSGEILTNMSWPLNYSEANGVADILPNITLNTELDFQVRLMLNAAAPLTCKITAAMTP